ncbi:swi5-dependent recombination DNA repair protein 1 homolog [Vanacampus margaritifer]
MAVTPKNVSYSSPSSPCGSNEAPQQKMSASLKARLKKTRHYFTSPVAKRLRVDDGDGQRLPSHSRTTTDDGDYKNPPLNSLSNANSQEGSEKISGMTPGPAHSRTEDFAQRRERLGREVKDKTETLRRLRMVKMYRSKNDPARLQTLIDKWRSCAQNALYELRLHVPAEARQASLSELIDLFGLDEKILHFDRAEDDFDS